MAGARSSDPDGAAAGSAGSPHALVGTSVVAVSHETRARETYRVDQVLGVGGMAAVYSATTETGDRAALKLLAREAAEDARVRRRFLLEKAMADRIEHPARVPVSLAGATTDGQPILVMELVPSENVETVRRRLGGKLPLASALRVAEEVLDFLVACHAAGVLHRDIKTANILFTPGRPVRVVDFGIAHCHELDHGTDVADMTLGTPAFMSPEQVTGLPSEVDARADVYSVGAVLYTLLTGKRLHRGRTHDESLFLCATQAVPSLVDSDEDVPHEVAAVVDRALRFQRDARFRDAAEMLEEVRRLRMLHEGRLSMTSIAYGEEVPSSDEGGTPSGVQPIARAPDARGTLHDTPLPHLLLHTFSRGLDGTLVVTHGELRETVEFVSGAPIRRGTSVAADPMVGALARIAQLPEEATYRFFIRRGDPSSQRQSEGTRIDPLSAILVTARRMRGISTFQARMRATLDRLGERRIALHPAADPERFGLATVERQVLDAAIEYELSYTELLEARVAPRDVVDALLYALGITRHLDVGIANAWPVGVPRP